MPFQIGHKKYGGRKPNTKNKRAIGYVSKNINFAEILEKHNFCPGTALIQCYEDARKIYESYGVIYEAIANARELKGLVPLDDKADKYLKLAVDCAKELGSYTYPKLKATEHVKVNPLEGLTAQQKLEAVKQMVKILETEVDGSIPVQSSS